MKSLPGIALLMSALATFGSPKVAILSDANQGPIADLVTASLSTRPEIEVLERSQIRQILEEQKLQMTGLARSDALRIGRLLRADGVVLIEKAKIGGREALSARFMAVGPGVLLGILHNEPGQEVQQAGESIATRVLQLAPKLEIQLKDAIPISVLNLRSASSANDSKEIESQLTLLLIHRLVHEPKVFVLEREKMLPLLDEKWLAKDTMSEFWSGSQLIDGVIETSLPNAEDLKITLRMRRAGTAELHFQATGSKSDLLSLVGKLNAGILKALDQQPSAQPWDTKAEAAQFLQEARWANAFGLFDKVRAAAESSLALGLHPPELTRLRVYSWRDELGAEFANRIVKRGLFGPVALQRIGYPSDGFDGMTGGINTPLSGPMSPSTGFGPPPGMGIQLPGIGMQPQRTPPNPPSSSSGQLPSPDGLCEAFEVYLDRLDEELIPETRTPTQIDWRWMGTELLTVSSYLLYRHEEQPTDEAMRDSLNRLRMLIQKTADRMTAGNRTGLPEIYCLKAFYAPLWYDHPEEMLKAWREIANLPHSERDVPLEKRSLVDWRLLKYRLLESLLSAFQGNLPFGEQRKRLWADKMKPHWQSWIDDLEKHGTDGEYLFGMAVGAAIATPPEARDAFTSRMILRLARSLEKIKADEISWPEYMLLPPASTPKVQKLRRNCLRDVFLAYCENTNSAPGTLTFNFLFHPEDYSKEESAAAYASLGRFDGNISKAGKRADLGRAYIQGMRAKLAAKYPELDVEKASVQKPAAIVPVSPNPQVARPAGPTLVVRRFRRLVSGTDIPVALDRAGTTAFARNFTTWGGSIWTAFPAGKRGFLARYDAVTLEGDVFPVPELGQDSEWKDTTLELQEGHAFIFGGGKLFDFGIKSQDWTLKKYGVVPMVQPLIVGDHLYLATGDEIRDVNLETGANELLASARRNPAQGPLDNIRFARFELMHGKRGELFVKAIERATTESKQPGFHGFGRYEFMAWDVQKKEWRIVRPVEAAEVSKQPTPWSVVRRSQGGPPVLQSPGVQAVLDFQMSDADRQVFEGEFGGAETAKSTAFDFIVPTSLTDAGLFLHIPVGRSQWAWFIPSSDLETLVAGMAGTAAPAAKPVINSRAQRIVFGLNTAFHVLNEDGTGDTLMPGIPNGSYVPAVSPDGTQIAFVSGIHGNKDIYVMRTDGSGLRNITDSWADDANPAWSPDGRFLAFSSKLETNRQICVVRADGTGFRQVTSDSMNHESPRWSPDGRKIVHVRQQGALPAMYSEGAVSALFIINADGSEAHALTDFKAKDSQPDWSPDGKCIVFVSDRDKGTHFHPACAFELYTIKPDGSGLKRLTLGNLSNFEPAWSPDGRWIACKSYYRHMAPRDMFIRGEIYVLEYDREKEALVNDGLEGRRLTVTKLDATNPAWWPASATKASSSH